MSFVAPSIGEGPAYERLARQIRRRIEDGVIAPGARLPSETQLAVEAQVSRSTVREALRMLQEAGLIERPSPRIMVVSERTDETAERQLVWALGRHLLTFDRLHEALSLLEPELSRLAAERADEADLRELARNLEAQELALKDFAQWNRLDQEFHLAIAEIADNPALMIARAPVTTILMPTLTGFVTSQSVTAAGLRWHRRILEQIELRDGEAAALMTRRHVDDFRSAWIASGGDLEQVIAVESELTQAA